MTDNEKIEIQLSKVKLTKLLVFSILFLIGGLWIAISNPQVSNPIFNSSILKFIAAYGGIFMGVLGIYFFSKKLLDKESGLIIDNQGIYDNTTIFNLGLVPWSDISQIYEKSVQASIASKQYFITVDIMNPDKYILHQKSTFKRKLLSLNSKNNRLIINISTNGLKVSHKDLLVILNKSFEKYKL